MNNNTNNNKPKFSTDVTVESELINKQIIVEVNPSVEVTYEMNDDIKLSFATKANTSTSTTAFAYDIDEYTLNTDIGISYNNDLKVNAEIKSLYLNSANNVAVTAVPATATTAAVPARAALEATILNWSIEKSFKDLNTKFVIYDDSASVYNGKKYGLDLNLKNSAAELDISFDSADKLVLEEIAINFDKLSEIIPTFEVLKDVNIDYVKVDNELIMGYGNLVDFTFKTDSSKFTDIELNVSELINRASELNVRGISLKYDIADKKLVPAFKSNTFNLFRK